MPEMPGLAGEVYFGDVESPLPDWRAESADESDGDSITPEQRAAVIGMLGFDPRESGEEPDESSLENANPAG